MNAFMKNWRGFWRLSGFERGIVLEAIAALTVTWVGLRLAGFRRWKNALSWLAPANVPMMDAGNTRVVDSARVIVRMEEAAARHHFFRPNCLEQSMVVWWLLRLRGISADLRIGARKEAGQFEAHAWVESGGEVLSSAAEDHRHFVPFDGPLNNMETQTH